ncbi:hypothetical protein [Azospirillum endophyticum]
MSTYPVGVPSAIHIAGHAACEKADGVWCDPSSAGDYPAPPSRIPWQEIQRGIADQLDEGMVLKPAVKYQRVAQTMGIPRDNH